MDWERTVVMRVWGVVVRIWSIMWAAMKPEPPGEGVSLVWFGRVRG